MADELGPDLGPMSREERERHLFPNKTTSAIDLVEWKRLEDAFHDSLPNQGEPGDPAAGKALCQFLYDNSETLRDTITRLQAALTKCGDKFEEYAELHRAKLADTSSPRAIEAIMEKVMRNREMADMCRSSVGGE